jgi:hypothetical protein
MKRGAPAEGASSPPAGKLAKLASPPVVAFVECRDEEGLAAVEGELFDRFTERINTCAHPHEFETDGSDFADLR